MVVQSAKRTRRQSEKVKTGSARRGDYVIEGAALPLRVAALCSPPYSLVKGFSSPSPASYLFPTSIEILEYARLMLMYILPTTLLFSFWTLGAYAADNSTFGETCSQADQRLEFGTYQFQSDCDPTTFCNSSSICDHKGCRKDEFPFGYSNPSDFPPKCPSGFFCPDEGDACQPLLPVGSPCQFNRDGERLASE